MTSFPHTEAERQTWRDRIDPKLKAAGWRVVPFDPNRPLSSYNRCAIEEYVMDNGPADYALCIDGRLVGIVEANKLTARETLLRTPNGEMKDEGNAVRRDEVS